MSEKERSTHKPRIETLSDLIFGLALSIGALTLIGQPPTDFSQLLQSILFYAFSFTILISVWYGYTRNMALLRMETGKLMALNVVLLFLVSIEPFLFNQLFQLDAALVENVSIIYAIDLGGLFLIQALLANTILADKTNPPEVRHGIQLRRNTFLLSSGLFFVSTLPIFWSWSITITNGVGVPLRVVLWLTPIVLPSIRRYWEKKSYKPLTSTK
jgi:uncharacterized membrane protein